jgi:hypothetical protein
LREGLGKTIRSDGSYFEGFFKNDYANGFGKNFLLDKYEEGYYVEGLINGKGKRIFEDDRYFKGYFKDGKYEGKGLFKY